MEKKIIRKIKILAGSSITFTGIASLATSATYMLISVIISLIGLFIAAISGEDK